MTRLVPLVGVLCAALVAACSDSGFTPPLADDLDPTSLEGSVLKTPGRTALVGRMLEFQEPGDPTTPEYWGAGDRTIVGRWRLRGVFAGEGFVELIGPKLTRIRSGGGATQISLNFEQIKLYQQRDSDKNLIAVGAWGPGVAGFFFDDIIIGIGGGARGLLIPAVQ